METATEGVELAWSWRGAGVELAWSWRGLIEIVKEQKLPQLQILHRGEARRNCDRKSASRKNIPHSHCLVELGHGKTYLTLTVTHRLTDSQFLAKLQVHPHPNPKRKVQRC